MKCNVCSSKKFKTFYYAGFQPVSENVFLSKKIDALNFPKEKVHIVVCKNCYHVYNKNFNPKKINYFKNYKYTAPVSKKFSQHLKSISDLLAKNKILNKKILEIGCGNGEFLKKFAKKYRCQAVGVDPSYNGKLKFDKSVKFIKKKFDNKLDIENFDFIFCRQAIEHFENLENFLFNINKKLNLGGMIFLETPDLGWIIKNSSIWDFYYEHCNYFKFDTMKFFFQHFGFGKFTKISLFQNQYLGLIAYKNSNIQINEVKKFNINEKQLRYNKSFIKNLNLIKKNFLLKKNNIRKYLLANKKNKFAIWGCAAKGVTFVNTFAKYFNKNLIGLDNNKLRQNKYFPCQGSKIFKPNKNLLKKIDCILVINPSYINEIQSQLKKLNYKKNLISITNF